MLKKCPNTTIDRIFLCPTKVGLLQQWKRRETKIYLICPGNIVPLALWVEEFVQPTCTTIRVIEIKSCDIFAHGGGLRWGKVCSVKKETKLNKVFCLIKSRPLHPPQTNKRGNPNFWKGKLWNIQRWWPCHNQRERKPQNSWERFQKEARCNIW